MKALFAGLLLIVLVLLGPFGLVWVINTLLPGLDTPYTWKTWVAALVVLLVFAHRES